MKFSWWHIVFPVWQCVLKHRWSVLYLLLSLSEDPRKPSSRVSDTHTLNNYNKSTIIKYVGDTDLIPLTSHLPVLPRSETMGRSLPRPSPGTPTPPRSTAPGPRAWPWATERGARVCRPAWAPAASPAWESTRWMDPRRRRSHCWLGEHFQMSFHARSHLLKTHFWISRSLTRSVQATAPQTDINGINTKILIWWENWQ